MSKRFTPGMEFLRGWDGRARRHAASPVIVGQLVARQKFMLRGVPRTRVIVVVAAATPSAKRFQTDIPTEQSVAQQRPIRAGGPPLTTILAPLDKSDRVRFHWNCPIFETLKRSLFFFFLSFSSGFHLRGIYLCVSVLFVASTL